MRISICLWACLLLSIAHVNFAVGQVDPDGSVIVNFTEDFESGVANFSDANRELATLFQTEGVDDSAFIRAATNPDFQGVVFRAETDSRGPGAASGGASIVGLGTLAPGAFQEITIDLTDTSQFFNEGAPFTSFADQIGNIQITTSTDSAVSFNVDLDNFQISTSTASVPEPSSLTMLVGAVGLFGLRRRR